MAVDRLLRRVTASSLASDIFLDNSSLATRLSGARTADQSIFTEGAVSGLGVDVVALPVAKTIRMSVLNFIISLQTDLVVGYHQ